MNARRPGHQVGATECVLSGTESEAERLALVWLRGWAPLLTPYQRRRLAPLLASKRAKP